MSSWMEKLKNSSTDAYFTNYFVAMGLGHNRYCLKLWLITRNYKNMLYVLTYYHCNLASPRSDTLSWGRFPIPFLHSKIHKFTRMERRRQRGIRRGRRGRGFRVKGSRMGRDCTEEKAREEIVGGGEGVREDSRIGRGGKGRASRSNPVLARFPSQRINDFSMGFRLEDQHFWL